MMNVQLGEAAAGKPFGMVFQTTKPRSRARSIIVRSLRIFIEEIARAEAGDDLTFQSMILLSGRYGMLGMTQKELARELFVTPMTLQRWGKGEKLPLVITRKAIFNRLADLAEEIVAVPSAGQAVPASSQIIPFPARGSRS